MTRLLSKREVAELLGVHPLTVMRLAAAGDFPRPIKLGRGVQAAVRFDEADVKTWLTAKKAAHAAEAVVS